MSNGPDGGLKKCQLLAHAINNEPLSTSLLGNEKEPNVFNSIFNKLDGISLHQIANETYVVSLAVLKNWINVTTGRSPTEFPCQQPQKQDEAYAAYMHPNKNELSCSAMTQGKERSKHPAVEQLAMIGTRLAIPEQDHRKSAGPAPINVPSKERRQGVPTPPRSSSNVNRTNSRGQDCCRHPHTSGSVSRVCSKLPRHPTVDHLCRR